ncbi:MAG: Mrp/NBP35 family ATP-binding protein [Methanotrichaceae archaeon]|nr:Mrp/NBP35 family ATP-binding protein [Methanotrichaceae archaeon]
MNYDTSRKEDRECDRKCSTCAEREGCPAGEEESAKRMGKIGYKIIVASGKGGVGKSTVAVNLAAALRDQGFRVGLLDADITGPSVPMLLGIDERGLVEGRDGILPVDAQGIKVISMGLLLKSSDSAVIWRGPLKMAAIKQFLGDVEWGELDFLIVDLPPGTSDEPLSIVQLVPELSGAVIVTTPQDVALLDSRKAINMAKSLKVPVLGVIENMSGLVCPGCGEVLEIFGSGGGERAAKEMGVPFLGSLPIDPNIASLGDHGETFSGGRDAASDSFDHIVDELKRRLSL